MIGKDKNTAVGCLILAVLWAIGAVSVWPLITHQSEPVSERGESAAMNQTLIPEPTIPPIPTPVPPSPTPEPTPTPPLVIQHSHVVQSGETLQSIAALHHSSICLLASVLTVDDLTPGNIIMVPVPNPAACASMKVHVVEENDTLFSISRRYDVTLEALMAENLLPDTTIRIGDVLCIPQVE